jgi:hypothetical protein
MVPPGANHRFVANGPQKADGISGFKGFGLATISVALQPQGKSHDGNGRPFPPDFMAETGSKAAAFQVTISKKA